MRNILFASLAAAAMLVAVAGFRADLSRRRPRRCRRSGRAVRFRSRPRGMVTAITTAIITMATTPYGCQLVRERYVTPRGRVLLPDAPRLLIWDSGWR